MGVMNQMRDKMSIILGIVIVAFLATIFFSWGMGVDGPRGQKNIIAQVNKTDIPLEQYFQALNQQLSYYRDQLGQDIDEMTRIRIQDQVFENLVQDVLIRQEIKKLKLEATDEEIYFYLENNPPQYIREAEIFHTDGQFDHQKYLDILRDPSNPYGINWVPIEEEIGRILPYEKLSDHISSSVIITENEIRQAYEDDNVKYDIEHLTVLVSRIQDDEVSLDDKELRAYYEKNKSDYKTPETKILQYVSWSKEASAEDTTLAMNEIDEILIRLNEGESFEDLARVFSQDPSASEGGGLGYFGRGQMVKPFEDEAFSAPLNKVIGPVPTQFGYHLIRVEDKKVENGETQIKASHILVKIQAGPNTLDRVAGEARIFTYDAEDQGFERALELYKLKADTTSFGISRESNFYPGLGFMPGLTRWAFNNKNGKITEQPFETENLIVVAQIIDSKPESFQPFDEVRNTIERQLRREKKETMSLVMARELAQQGDDLYKLKDESEKIRFGSEENVTIKNLPVLFRNNPAVNDLLRLAKLNDIVGPVKTAQGYSLIQPRKRSAVDEADFRLKREEIRMRLQKEKENAAIEAYLTALKDKATINDFRENFF
mgnify:CR=1 FL=1